MMTVMLAYLGPETMIPLASIVAAIGGVFMMGWRFVLLQVKRLFRLPGGGDPPLDDQTEPVEAPPNRAE